MPPLYGVVVAGPPGAGKSTMCAGLARYLELVGRPSAVVNLDPACEESGLTPFTIDMRNLVSVDDVMREKGLGPNGALVYSFEVLRARKWLLERLEGLRTSGDTYPYVIIDVPGQAELWTHSNVLQEILQEVVKSLDARLVVAHLVDANQCTRPASFVSAALLALTAMLRLELPHVNVLSKVDQLERFEANLPFQLSYFAEAADLRRLAPFCLPYDARAISENPDGDAPEDDQPQHEAAPIQRLTAAIADLVEEFNLVNFLTLDISDGDCVAHLLSVLDKAVGYPAAVHGPVHVIDDASNLFLGREDPDLFPGDPAQPPPSDLHPTSSSATTTQQQHHHDSSAAAFRSTGDPEADRDAIRRRLKGLPPA